MQSTVQTAHRTASCVVSTSKLWDMSSRRGTHTRGLACVSTRSTRVLVVLPGGYAWLLMHVSPRILLHHVALYVNTHAYQAQQQPVAFSHTFGMSLDHTSCFFLVSLRNEVMWAHFLPTCRYPPRGWPSLAASCLAVAPQWKSPSSTCRGRSSHGNPSWMRAVVVVTLATRFSMAVGCKSVVQVLGMCCSIGCGWITHFCVVRVLHTYPQHLHRWW